jgi:hypothetical protein
MNTDPMDYVATINWGDGKSSAATFKMTGTGDWDILGDHKYTRRGKFTVSIKLKDYGGATTRIITTIYVV